MMKTVLKVLLPLVVVALAAGFAFRMVKTRPKAKRAKALVTAMLVDVMQVKSGTHQVVIEATGAVVPERTVMLQPEISGVIRKEAAGFEVGRRFKKGEVMVRLDDRDLRLALKQRRSSVTTAKFDLTLERGRAHVAQQEWQLLDGKVKTTSSGRALALRKPQKLAAKARIAQAQAALEQVRLNLTRTRVTAPFDCIVREKRATIGQVVSPGAPIATLVGTRRFFVNVSVPVNRLSSLAVPGLNATEGALVHISQQGGGRHARTGRVVRLLSDLGPNGRMARLVVAVDRPLDPPPKVAEVNAKDAEWLPLLIGAYVRAEVQGKTLTNVVAIPRAALHEGDRVWVARDGKLDIRDVHIAWREKDRVLVDNGLKDGEQLVMSPIPGPRPGMGLRIRGEKGAKIRAANGPTAEGKKAPPADAPEAGSEQTTEAAR